MIYPRNVKLDSMLAWRRDMPLEPVRGLRWVIVKLLLVFSTLMAYSTWPARVNKYLLGTCVAYKGLIQSPQKSMKRLWTGLESGCRCKWQDGRESVVGRVGESRLLQPLESSWADGVWREQEDTHRLWTSCTIGAKEQKQEAVSWERGNPRVTVGLKKLFEW